MPAPSIQGLLYLILYVLLLGLLVWAVGYVLALLHVPDEVRRIVMVIVAILLLIWLLGTTIGAI